MPFQIFAANLPRISLTAAGRSLKRRWKSKFLFWGAVLISSALLLLVFLPKTFQNLSDRESIALSGPHRPISYTCHVYLQTGNLDIKIGPKNEVAVTRFQFPADKVKLIEYPVPEKLSTWKVAWPGKAPIETESFEAQTGSIGGSQGIRWRDPTGQWITAYLSFSDLVSSDGPSSLWGKLVQGDDRARDFNPETAATARIDCLSDVRTDHASNGT